MQNSIKISMLLLLFLPLFSGCGGGGGGSSEPTTASPSTSVSTTSSSSEIKSIATGALKVVDVSAVESLRVVCGDEEYKSDKNGEFACTKAPMKFYLGELLLGTLNYIPVDRTIYPQDIVGVARGATAHPVVTKISMLLESLDKDSVLENGISITSESIEKLNSYSSQYSSIESIDLDDLLSILKEIAPRVITAQEAQVNLTKSTAKAPALTYEQRSIGRIQE
jgi:hypothetical protein